MRPKLRMQKKRIIYTLTGIAIVISIDPLVRIFTTGGRLDVPNTIEIVDFLIRWANFLLGLIGVGALVALIWAGMRLIFHFGDEQATEQAKKIAIAAVIGLVLAFSAWVIVNFFAASGGA